ncbi:hypothetical protein FRC08_008657 [Ceratobasidium sp. 394]|nr:hypothetical protein FRC08_008657 [Ceratobasidium sp. 394]
MPRPARRPTPIALPTCPMDTLWEVDESLPDGQAQQHFTRRHSSTWFATPESTEPLHSIFEDDDGDFDVSFPLPPVSLPSPVRRMFASPRKTAPKRPVCSPSPRSSSLFSTPRCVPAQDSFPRVPSPSVAPRRAPRAKAEAQRPVSPSSASSSDTEPPRTPPAASTSLPAPSRKPAYILAPPPPAEWESAIDALFASDYESDDDEFVPIHSAPVHIPIPIQTRRTPPPPPPRSRARARSPESYLSYSPVSSPGPLSPSQLPMSPTFARALGSPGFMPTSPGNSDHSHSSRPARPSRRIVPERATIPVQLLLRS